MKKRTKGIIKASIAAAVLAVAFVLIFNHFHVAGTEFKGVFQMSETTEVTLEGRRLLQPASVSITLNAEQKEMLKELFKESSFRRVFFYGVRDIHTDDRMDYEILINDRAQGIGINFASHGGEFMTVVYSPSFDGWRLKINNDQWNAAMEEIIAAADAN